MNRAICSEDVAVSYNSPFFIDFDSRTVVSSSDGGYMVAVQLDSVFNKGDVIFFEGELTLQRRISIGFTRVDPFELDTIEGLQLEEEGFHSESYSKGEFSFSITVPFNNAHLLFYKHNNGFSSFKVKAYPRYIIPKYIFTIGSTYTKNSISFKKNDLIYYKKNDSYGSTNHKITFNENTTFTLNKDYYLLVLRDDKDLLAVNTKEVLSSDIVLLYYSSTYSEFVAGALYPEYISSKISNKNSLTNIPFKAGGTYKGVSKNYVEYNDGRTDRVRVELYTQNLDIIKSKTGYKIAVCLFEDSIPTSKCYSPNISLSSVTIRVQELMSGVSEFVPNKIIIAIAKEDDSDFEEVYSVDDFIEITYTSLPASVLNTGVRETSVVKVGLIEGAISYNTGNSSTTSEDINLYKHTPRLIKIEDDIKILNEETLSGRINYYDKNKTYLGYIYINALTDKTVKLFYGNSYYIRLTFNTTDADSVLPADYILLESKWEDANNIEEYLGLPSDEGFVNIAFPVRVNLNIQPSTEVSEITSQYTKSTDYGVLHLPESYSANGKPTPLIIYLHGESERYSNNSVRFGNNVRYSPEWSAAGYAQMDVNMFPKIYNVSGAQAGFCEDTLCVEAAYRWVIEHYNIRRDGVYLFGRSRGGQAVFSILGHYNSVKFPVICALSNSGANALFLYKLWRKNPTTGWWNAFCLSTGLSSLNPPDVDTTNIIIKQPTIVSFLRDNINMWWKKAMTGFPMMVENPTQYKTPVEIFDLLVSSYNDASEPGKTFIENFVESCKYHSPVPLRFDWCVGDTVQTRYSPGTKNVDNYGLAGMKAFVNSEITGNSIYREWPECTGGEPHYHEKFNLYDGNYTLPNGVVVTNPSMAQVEWLLWAQSHDNRDL